MSVIGENVMSISATFEYYGFSDYWQGNGRRWDDDAGCLFAYASRNMTLRDVVDQWVDDFMGGGDCDTMGEDVTEEEVRKALESLVDRSDHYSGDLSEVYEPTKDTDDLFDATEEEENDAEIEDDSDDCESPIIVVLIEQDTE